MATKHPDRVDKLVLMGSMGVPSRSPRAWTTVWGYDGTLEGMRKVMDYFAYYPELINEELAQVRLRGQPPSPASRSRSPRCSRRPRQRWVEAMTVPEEEIRALPHRTLIVHGREDQVIPLSNSYKLLELIDNADLAVFSHCGHWSMIERTADFNRLVRDFFLGE